MKKKQEVRTVDSCEMSIRELMLIYLDEKRSDGLSEKTLMNYQQSFSCFMRKMGDEITLDDFTDINIIRFKNHLQEEELSLASMNHYLRDIRAFVNWLAVRGYLQQRLQIRLIRGQEAIKETYTEEELLALLARPKAKASFAEWREWTIVHWILGTGNRISTICNLQMRDIDLDMAEITIREQKNKKPMVVPMAKNLVVVVKEYVRRCRYDAKQDDYLFCNQYGEKMAISTLQCSLRRYNHSRGVEKTSAHALRHTFAKMWVNNGGDLFRLQKMLGHSTLEMTRHYVNLYGSDLRCGFEEVSPLNTVSRKRGGSRSGRIILNN